MAEASSSKETTTESDIIAMKETLRAQQQLLQKLYAELDEEREASATAASEALDMILRLQGEKAAVKMEASQYARMAEEKIEHAETTLEIFEELMFQKDMEIASLEFQVQAHKRKLVSLGCDPNLNELEFTENQLSHRNDELQNAENGQNQHVRRLSSLPPFPVNKNSLRAPRKRERSPSPLPLSMNPRLIMEDKTEREAVSQSMDLAKKSADSSHETLDSYWEQIKKLDERVNEISDCKENGDRSSNLKGRRHRSCSLYPRSRSKTPSITSPDQVLHREIKQNREATADPSSSVSVHDVFEVPQHHENHRVSESGKHRIERQRSDAENRLTKPDPEVPEEKAESHLRYDSSKLMKLFSNLETQAHSPSENNNNNNNNSNINDNKITCMFGPKKEGMGVECNGQAEFHVLSKRIERLEKERERLSTRQEITHEGDGQEQLRLLKEILSRLKSIQEEMRRPEAKKSPHKDDVPLSPLQEAMLYFWF